MTARSASGVPRYVRPRPDRVLGLRAPAWTVLIAVALVGLVELLARSGAVSGTELVPVSEMLAGIAGLLVDPEFLVQNLLWTVGLIAVSFALATVLGVGLAYTMWRARWWRRAAQPYLNVYYAVPTFALYPILVVLFGTGAVPIVLLAVAFSSVVIAASALTGFGSVAPSVNKLAASLRLRPGQYLRRVLLPSAAPDIAAGMKLGFVYALIGVLATEFILATRGLGQFISHAYITFDAEEMYAGILFVCLFALGANLGLSALLNRFDWRRS
ncbi:ABC transporter permease [Pseudonocardia sp. MH-G8]|uniref:ABC transporter permease n=1 Tax=Pseudonocardia sp. MH-G8 TaxID=1854588 RepID=UPI000BA126AA|nr:ABC transporter permease subunit [Pseudonocardia sp. MH-G8]OZM78062.1 nitrate ABC transporter permease [Pseudonocardia sp. MH-G8]